MSDGRVLNALASEMGVEIGCKDVGMIRRELRTLSRTTAPRAVPPRVGPGVSAVATAALEQATLGSNALAARPGTARVVLETWPELIDAGRLLDGAERIGEALRNRR